MHVLRTMLLCSISILFTACGSHNPIQYRIASDAMLDKTGAFNQIDRKKIKDEIIGFSIHPESEHILITGKKFQYLVPPSETVRQLMQPRIAQNVKLSSGLNDAPLNWYYSYVNREAQVLDPPQGLVVLSFCLKKNISADDEAYIRSTMKIYKDNACFWANLKFQQYYQTTAKPPTVSMTTLSKPYPIVFNIDTLKDAKKLQRQNRNAAILSPFAQVADATLTIGQYLALPITMWF